MANTPVNPENEHLRFPIGRFEKKESYTVEELENYIDQIQRLPIELENLMHQIQSTHLKASYREGGWNLRQVVHHIADSHTNALIRIKLALTEENPTIKPYAENAWAELPDTLELPLDISLSLLKPLHTKLAYVLRNIEDEDFDRTVFHPEHESKLSIGQLTALYAWHGRHHLGHIKLILGVKI